MIYHFLSDRMKIKKVQKLAVNLNDKTECIIHIKYLKQTLNYGLLLKNLHRIIKFKQKAWLKSYININTDLRKKSNNDFDKDFFKLTQFFENYEDFEKT